MILKKNEKEEDIKDNKSNKENDINENNVLSKLKILLINLEAKNVNINDIKEKLKIFFENSFEKFKKNKNLNETKKEVIEKVFNTFKEYLGIPEENHVDKIYLSNLIKYLYDQNDTIDEFQNYLDAILENYIDFSKLGENKENIIFNYIVDFMQVNMMQKKKKN